MILMQYRFTLPASYDMATIEQRIANNGAKLNGFAGLVFKAYLFARTDDVEMRATENRYAPLYLWRDANGMHRFLHSAGFATVTRDFGWPTIDTWTVLNAPQTLEQIRASRFVAINQQKIEPHSDLTAIKSTAMLSAWDVSRWQCISVDFLKTPPMHGKDVYRIGYVASEKADSV